MFLFPFKGYSAEKRTPASQKPAFYLYRKRILKEAANHQHNHYYKR